MNKTRIFEGRGTGSLGGRAWWWPRAEHGGLKVKCDPEVVSEEQEEEDVYEIEINGKTYYVMNEVDSIIYEADEEGEITIDAGIYKNGAPTFY